MHTHMDTHHMDIRKKSTLVIRKDIIPPLVTSLRLINKRMRKIMRVRTQE